MLTQQAALLPLLTAANLLSSPASAVNDCHGVKNFTQLVDHADSNTHYGNATFLQQYQLDTSAFKPGGPILFFQGNEAVQMFCIEKLILPTWAKELGAAVATLEHRFFGDSVPSHEADPMIKFKTLTLDNVMLDSVNFVEWIKSTVPGASNSKVIVQGASYGASLSTWLRLNYPDIFYGAISSAPVLRALGFSSNDTDNYNWQSWISRSISYQSAYAASRIRDAFQDLQRRIHTPEGRSGLQSAFNLCSAIDSEAVGQILLIYIQETYGFATQFNYAASRKVIGDKSIAIGYQIPTPLNALINRTLAVNADNSLQVLNVSLALYMEQFPGCVNLTPDTSTGSPAGAPPFPAIEFSVFSYITCSYLTLSNLAVPPGAIFPVVPLDIEATVPATCKRKYNTTILSQAELQKKYRFTQKDIEDAERLLIVAAEYDPTASIGPKAWDARPNANASRLLYVSNMAHCEDTYTPLEEDKATVIEARHYELQLIKEWLG